MLKIEPLFNEPSTAEKTTAFNCFASVKSLNEGPQFQTRQLTPTQPVTRQHLQSVTERLKAHSLFTNEIDFDTPLELEWNDQPIVYTDTHIITRMAVGRLNDLSQKAIDLINNERLFYSPMAGLELHYLYERNCLPCTPDKILSHLFKEAFLQVSDISFAQIALKAREINWTRDPFDCLIAAEASYVHIEHFHPKSIHYKEF